MKTIGLIGGMSWESTVGYYRQLNEGVKRELGGLHSAKIAMYSVDFAPIEKLQNSGDWITMAIMLVDAAKKIEAAGADFLLIGTNTMHKVADDVAAAIDIPLLHIADATAEVLLEDGIETVGLLGTAFTMEQDFYKGRLAEKYDLTVMVPGKDQRAIVHRMIYEELCLGTINEQSKKLLLDIISRLGEAGAQAVILGCTELGLLAHQTDTAVKLYDTTAIHAQKAVELATAGS